MLGEGFPGGASVKACNAGDIGNAGSKKKKKKRKKCRFNPWVRKIPWRRACNTLQYSCLENPMDRGT